LLAEKIIYEISKADYSDGTIDLTYGQKVQMSLLAEGVIGAAIGGVLGDAETGFNIAVSVARNNDFNRKHMEKELKKAKTACSQGDKGACIDVTKLLVTMNMIQPVIQKTTEISANIMIGGAFLGESLNLVTISEPAKGILKSYYGGDGQTHSEFNWNSAASIELYQESPYVQEMSQFLIEGMIAKYGNTIPNNASFVEGEDGFLFKNFSPIDGARGLGNGIHVGDVVGSFSKLVTVKVKDGYFYFTGFNKTSFGSFSGNNIIDHNLVENNDSDKGKFRDITQTFIWRVPVPKKYRAPSTPPRP